MSDPWNTSPPFQFSPGIRAAPARSWYEVLEGQSRPGAPFKWKCMDVLLLNAPTGNNNIAKLGAHVRPDIKLHSAGKFLVLCVDIAEKSGGITAKRKTHDVGRLHPYFRGPGSHFSSKFILWSEQRWPATTLRCVQQTCLLIIPTYSPLLQAITTLYSTQFSPRYFRRFIIY